MSDNLPVADVQCPNCGEIFELKSKKNHIGSKIADGAYHTMIKRINSNLNPELFILQYSSTLSVDNLIFVPKFFFTPNIIEQRKPLSINSKRAGWIGCNILYNKIPLQGKIKIIHDSKEIKIENVLNQFNQVKHLQTNNLNLRGWMLDILNCVNNIQSESFTLQDIYNQAVNLQSKHQDNHNIKSKIRQQLQFLRDKGFIEFIKRGKYRKVI